jgi:uncharacterized protein YjiS (DUF1127 family)
MYISTLLRAFAAWRTYRADVQDLSALDDCILRDIGSIARASLKRLALAASPNGRAMQICRSCSAA